MVIWHPSEQISFDPVACEARKTPAVENVFFLDFPFYRNNQAGTFSYRFALTLARAETDYFLLSLSGGGFFKCGKKPLGAGWGGHGMIEDDGLRAHFFTIEVFVGPVIRTKSGTCERDPSEESAGAGVGKNFCAQGDICFSGGRSAHRACGGGSVATELDLTGENAGSGTLAHEEKNEVSGITTDLQTGASACEGYHRRGTPGAVEGFAAATSHHAAARIVARGPYLFLGGGVRSG